jgi:hypothetical protein
MNDDGEDKEFDLGDLEEECDADEMQENADFKTTHHEKNTNGS